MATELRTELTLSGAEAVLAKLAKSEAAYGKLIDRMEVLDAVSELTGSTIAQAAEKASQAATKAAKPPPAAAVPPPFQPKAASERSLDRAVERAAAQRTAADDRATKAADKAAAALEKLAAKAQQAQAAEDRRTARAANLRLDRELKPAGGPAQALKAAEANVMKARMAGDPAALLDAQINLHQRREALQRAERNLARPTAIQPALPGGPAARLEKAAQNLALARQSGDPNKLMDAQIAHARAQSSLAAGQKLLAPKAAAGGSDLSKSLSTLIRSTRFEGGGGLMPLVGRTMDVLMQLGPVGDAAVAATAGIVLMGAAASEAAKTTREFATARFTSGGTTGEQAQLDSLGSAIGKSGQDMADLSRRLAEQLASNPMARSLTGQIDAPGALGAIDKTKNLFALIDKLRSMSEPQAIRTARAAGVEELLQYRNLSAETLASLRRDAQMRAALFSPEATKNATEWQAQVARLTDAAGTMVTTFGSVINSMIDFPKAIGVVANSLNDFSAGIGALNPKVRDAEEARQFEIFEKRHPAEAWLPFSKAIARMEIHDRPDIYGPEAGKNGPADAHTSALEANTEGLNRMAQLIGDSRRFIGDASQTGGGVPAAWRYQQGRAALQGQAVAVGAFRI